MVHFLTDLLTEAGFGWVDLGSVFFINEIIILIA